MWKFFQMSSAKLPRHRLCACTCAPSQKHNPCLATASFSQFHCLFLDLLQHLNVLLEWRTMSCAVTTFLGEEAKPYLGNKVLSGCVQVGVSLLGKGLGWPGPVILWGNAAVVLLKCFWYVWPNPHLLGKKKIKFGSQ